MMNIKRREFLLFLSGFAGTVALSSLQSCNFPGLHSSQKSLNFKPLKGPLPVPSDGIAPAQQIAEYSSYEVLDDLLLPEGFTYDAIAQWGDPVGDSRFGYNNDYLSFIETAPNEGYLVINFEYVSAGTWMQTYPLVIQKPLPLEAIQSGMSKASKGETPTTINAFALADNNPLKAQIQQICEEALIDQGLGVISLRQTPEGQWERTNSPADRRISGISGLKDGRYLKVNWSCGEDFSETAGTRISRWIGRSHHWHLWQLCWWDDPLGNGIECGRKFPIPGVGTHLCRWLLFRSRGINF